MEKAGLKKLTVVKGTYRDSITLLRVSQGVAKVPGVKNGAVVMATPLNKRVLSDMGFKDKEVSGAQPDDMLIAVEGRDEGSLRDAMAEAEKLLSAQASGAGGPKLPRSLAEAAEANPGSNLAFISVPGAYAKHEAEAALRSGLNVFLFSSNVSRRDERELKVEAAKRGLLVMGPDCGTSIINHVVLGFGNAVRSGPVGIVSASGTGLQEVSCLVHRYGSGVSQGIGTGGGDMSDEVGGLTTLKGIKILAADRETKVIVVVSKPPGEKARRKIDEAIEGIRKPVVTCYIGTKETAREGKHRAVATLREAAEAATELSGRKPAREKEDGDARAAFVEASSLSESQRYVRGVFAGGTLCYEAQVVLAPMLGRVYSNSPVDARDFVSGSTPGRGNTCIDFGAEEFVIGRAHPMIDYTIRKMRLVEEAKDPGTAVLLFDVELGLGSNPDPAGELVPAVEEARSVANASGRHLAFVASIVGTDGDFQDMARQKRALRDAGVIVSSCSAEAAETSALIAARGRQASRGER
jgi:FdrA protein